MKIERTKGFTIVELLIVIVVIGILAAISIVAYNGIQERARTSSVLSALSQAAKKLAVYQVENPDVYPADKTALEAIGIKDSATVTYQYTLTASTPNTYCITATSGSTSYKLPSSSTTPAQGGCAGHGVGGATPITNLVLNPSFETGITNWAYRWYGNTGGAGTNSLGSNGGYSGNGYMHKTWTVAGTASDNGFSSNGSSTGLPVTGGSTYTLSGYMRTNRSDYSARTGLTWYDNTNTVIGSSVYWGTGTTIPANTWQRISQTATAPANAVKVLLYFSNGNSIAWAVNDTLSLDAVMLTEGTSAPNYADGSSTNWVWNGTPNASTSTGPA